MTHIIRFGAGLSVVAAVVLSFVWYGPARFDRTAQAITNNYAKTATAPNNQLTATEWNNLLLDFVRKDGDTMTGALNMGGQRVSNLGTPTAGNDAATRQFVLDRVSGTGGGIRDSAGNALKMVCGQTPPGATAWQLYSSIPNTAYVDAVTNTGLSTVMFYLTSIGGASYHMQTNGVTSVLNPTVNGFRVFVLYNGSGYWDVPTITTNYQWFVNWCAVGT